MFFECYCEGYINKFNIAGKTVMLICIKVICHLDITG